MRKLLTTTLIVQYFCPYPIQATVPVRGRTRTTTTTSPWRSSCFIEPLHHCCWRLPIQEKTGFPFLRHSVVVIKARPCDDENYFLHQVEATVANVLEHNSHRQHQQQQHGGEYIQNVWDLPAGEEREAWQVAKRLNRRLEALRRNNDCPRCWMQRKHCICESCLPVDVNDFFGMDHDDNDPFSSLQRIFLVMHHKEIALKVDTAKLILSAFPSKCRLVVAGIGSNYQESMKEMNEAILDNSTSSRTTNDDDDESSAATSMLLLLFPDEKARTVTEIITMSERTQQLVPQQQPQQCQKYDLIVLDGTWAQARKFFSRYFSSNNTSTDPDMHNNRIQTVKLSDEAVDILDQEGSTESGHQLRRHCTSWRQIGTFEATRLFLRDWTVAWSSGIDGKRAQHIDCQQTPIWKKIEAYQSIANNAARKELGPPRLSTTRRQLKGGITSNNCSSFT